MLCDILQYSLIIRPGAGTCLANSDIKKKIEDKVSEKFCKANSSVSYKVIDDPHTPTFFHEIFLSPFLKYHQIAPAHDYPLKALSLKILFSEVISLYSVQFL